METAGVTDSDSDAAVGAMAGPLMRNGFALSLAKYGGPGRFFAELGHWAAVVRFPGDGSIVVEDVQCDAVVPVEAERILRSLATVAPVRADLRPTTIFEDGPDERDLARRAFWQDMAEKGLVPAGALREETLT